MRVLTLTLLAINLSACDFEAMLPGTCEAGTQAELNSCVEKAQARELEHILLTELIPCEEDGCGLRLRNMQRLKVEGLGPETGFTRTKNFDEPMVSVHHSSDIVMENFAVLGGPVTLDIETNKILECPTKEDCFSNVQLYDSHRVTLRLMTLRGGKPHNLTMSHSSDVVVMRSHISGASEFGIWAGTALEHWNRNFLFLENHFYDNRSNAILMGGSRGHVVNNHFEHNHWGFAFKDCGPNLDGPCAGGQLLVYSGEDMLIQGNHFHRTRLDQEETRLAPYDIELGLEPFRGDEGNRRYRIENNTVHYDSYNDEKWYFTIYMNNDSEFEDIEFVSNRFLGFPGPVERLVNLSTNVNLR